MTTPLRATISTATCGVAVLALAWAGSTGAGATPTAAHVHTETFTSRVQGHVPLGGQADAVEFAQDVAHGHVIGADVTTAHFHPATGLVTGEVTFVRPHGMMSGTFVLDTSTLALTGSIDSGVGRFVGVTGSFTGQAVNRKVTRVTLTYQG